MTTAPIGRTQRTVAALLLAALTMTVSGCSDDTPTDAEPTPSSSSAKPEPKPTQSTDPQADEKKAVLTAYDALSKEQAKAYQQASAKGTDLEKYATMKALGKIELDLHSLKQANAVIKGEIGHEAEVTKLDLKAKTPTADLRDCIDLSNYKTYDQKAKKVIPLPEEQPLRYYATAKAERWDGRWMVTDIDTQGGPKC